MVRSGPETNQNFVAQESQERLAKGGFAARGDRLMKDGRPFWYNHERHISRHAEDAADKGRAYEGHQSTSTGESRAGPRGRG